MRARLARLAAPLTAAACVACLLVACGQHDAPKRQVAKVTLLPDTPPPPPPPPPKEEKKPEPKEQVKVDTPKQDKPPEPQQLKMEGPAGDAPSPFAGGEVKNDYAGGEIGGGDPRLKFAYYTDRLAQEIQDDLERRNLHSGSGRFLLWLQPDGTVRQLKVLQTSGDADTEKAIELALADLRRVREPPPSDMPMPVGLEISMR